ncbi:hypothetical protein EVAR_19651_1 [Eumeta japonica]|uniref:Uncharacterized protein n=1 Tax=Eumeta variegata TaxID=151549 RepID=A0A4C1V2N7_EUMVA|nr:hypothetical protein EVAR_19651_1 [Eumeta japonica]
MRIDHGESERARGRFVGKAAAPPRRLHSATPQPTSRLLISLSFSETLKILGTIGCRRNFVNLWTTTFVQAANDTNARHRGDPSEFTGPREIF